VEQEAFAAIAAAKADPNIKPVKRSGLKVSLVHTHHAYTNGVCVCVCVCVCMVHIYMYRSMIMMVSERLINLLISFAMRNGRRIRNIPWISLNMAKH
jgi:hypothetical protein